MPNNQAARKRVKVSSTKQAQNRMVKSGVRTAIKKFQAAVATGELQQADTLLIEAVSKLDQAVSKGVVHKNAANRSKSRMAVHLQKAQG